MDEKKMFLAELQKVCKRFDVTIAACGCCDSPWADRHGKTWLLNVHVEPTMACADFRSSNGNWETFEV